MSILGFHTSSHRSPGLDMPWGFTLRSSCLRANFIPTESSPLPSPTSKQHYRLGPKPLTQGPSEDISTQTIAIAFICSFLVWHSYCQGQRTLVALCGWALGEGAPVMPGLWGRKAARETAAFSQNSGLRNSAKRHVHGVVCSGLFAQDKLRSRARSNTRVIKVLESTFWLPPQRLTSNL